MQIDILAHPNFRDGFELDRAISVINDQQDSFILVRSSVEWVKDEGSLSGTTNPKKVFAAKEKETGTGPAMVITRRPLREGYFIDWIPNCHLISTAAWEEQFPNRPVYLYLASMIAGGLALADSKLSEEVFDRQTDRHEREPCGCINDYCEVMTHIWFNMLHMHICATCEPELIQGGLSVAAAASIQKLLAYLRGLNTSYDDTRTPDVFISYSSRDEQLAERLSTDIQRGGFKTFFAKYETTPGDSIIGRVTTSIHGAKVFIIILSPDAVNSPWCREELTVAAKMESDDKICVIPILHRNCEPFPEIRDRVWLNMESDKYEKSLSKLLNKVREVVPPKKE